MTILKLDEWDVKVLRRLAESAAKVNWPDAEYLTEVLDEAEGITRQAGIVMKISPACVPIFEWDNGKKKPAGSLALANTSDDTRRSL